MAKATAVGGIFFKSQHPAKLAAWYAEHLGIDVGSYNAALFRWPKAGAERRGYTLWAPFAADTGYFGPGDQAYMINFCVDDLDALLAQLREAGVEVDPNVETTPQGKFGWLTDPEGHRVELWEPSDDPEAE